MNPTSSRFFLALLPPEEVQSYANQVKHHFTEAYNSRAALKSPPHITLQPPFLWQPENLAILEQSLKEFAQNESPIPITINGFGAFPPKVIFLDVEKTPQLLTLRQSLLKHLENSLGIFDIQARSRAFNPHLTVAFRDLKRQQFRLAWQEYQSQQVYFKFTVSHLTLLLHDGKRWNVYQDFSLGGK